MFFCSATALSQPTLRELVRGPSTKRTLAQVENASFHVANEVRIASKGEEALITGDFIHHPCQFARPDWAAAVDSDQTQSTKTRNEVFARLADTPTLVIGTHFATPTAGRIVRDGEAYRLEV